MKKSELRSLKVRTFFDLRHIMPGFTFILIMSVLNHDIIVEYVKNLDIEITALLGVVLPIIISAPAIGFLISQIWFIFYHLTEDLRFRELSVPGFSISVNGCNILKLRRQKPFLWQKKNPSE